MRDNKNDFGADKGTQKQYSDRYAPRTTQNTRNGTAMYQGLELLFPTQCPRCNKTGHVTMQRWNGEISKHCNKCGASFDKFGTSKATIDTQHPRTLQIAQILKHCQTTAKHGTPYTRKQGIPTDLLKDLATAGLLHNPAPDLYLTSSRGKRFLETHQALTNMGEKQRCA